MAFIKFATANAMIALQSMTDGMWVNARDDGDAARVKLLGALSDALAAAWPNVEGARPAVTFPATITVTDAIAVTAREVLDNCLDDSGYTDDADQIFQESDVVITRDRPEFECREAIDIAIEILTERAAETDTASPEGFRARGALGVLEMIRDQQGCEHFDPAVRDGKLTHLMNVIIFG